MPDATYRVEIDTTTPAEWAKMLDLFNDASIYQTWSYGRIRWGEENLSHIVLKREGEPLAVAQLRIVRPTRLKFGIAYLRWGPLFERRDRTLDFGIAVAMARALEQEYVHKRKLFLRIRPNAFIGSSRAAAVHSAFARFTPEPLAAPAIYRTLLLDLAPALEDLRKRLDVKWRNQLTRSEKNNLRVIAGHGKQEYRTFCEIYYQMLK